MVMMKEIVVPLNFFSEICKLKIKHKHVKVMVSSRPESVKELYHKIDSKLNIDHLKVKGIHEGNRKDFLKKYHDELIKAGLSKESTDDLLDFYDSCSAHHKDLYRLPINLVILSWLWGKAPHLVKTIKSAAGLYTAILDILNEKLVHRIVNSHPDVMSKINNDINELNYLTDMFKEKLFTESLEALRSDRVFINDAGVNILRDVCRDNGLPFSELQGSYLLSSLEWNIKLVETLQIPHKGFLDFYAAQCISSMLSQGGKRIKNILLELDGYTTDQNMSIPNVSKYQNLLQLLGGILALKDPTLVEEHGQDIINLLIETGVSNNSQWFDIYSDFNVNDVATKEFAKLIAPQLNLNNLIIKDADVEPLSNLLEYANIKLVTLEIVSTTMLTQLPRLIDVLRSKKCIIDISNIGDNQLNLWNSTINYDIKFNINKIVIKNKHNHLPFLNYCQSLNECRLQYFWRNLESPAPNLSRCRMRTLQTAVISTDEIPAFVKHLMIGLLVDLTSKTTQDPGISNLINCCPELEYLGVHIRAGAITGHLPTLPDVYTHLYLSQLSEESHLQWAVETARTLQPPREGYRWLVLVNCSLTIEQLCELVTRLATIGVTVGNALNISSTNINIGDKKKLLDATETSLHCNLIWHDDDDKLQYW